MIFPRLHGIVACDLETHDPALKRLGPGWCFTGKEWGKVVGIALAWGRPECPEAVYYPIRHETGSNLDADSVLKYVGDLSADPDVHFVFHNRLYDRGWLLREGIPSRGGEHDTQTLAALCDEYEPSYKLDALGRKYIGEGKDETELIKQAKAHGLNPKQDLWRLPGQVVAPYGMQDARLTLKLYYHYLVKLAAEDLGRVYDLEMRLQAVLLAMRMRGIRVDQDGAQRALEGLRAREMASVARLQNLAGVPVDVWANKSLGRAADKLGITYPLTPKRRDPSFNKDWLAAGMKAGMEFARLVHVARRANKMRSMYVQGYFLEKMVHGRIHPQFHPLRSEDKGRGERGAVSGRLASSDPNMQNLPSREDEGTKEDAKLIRSLCLPEEGEEWSACDISQQEPRLAVHYADLMGVPGAREAAVQYQRNPKTDFHQFVVELMGPHLAHLTHPRDWAKILNLAVMYGEGGAKLCKQLGLPTKWITKNNVKREVAGEEGEEILCQYNANVPFMRRISNLVSRHAKTRGYIITLGGRRRRFAQEEFDPKTRTWLLKAETAHYAFDYKAFNALIQGSAADQLKIAMVNGYEAFGIVPLVTVHDENGVNSTDGDRMVRVMVDAVQLRVPVVVDRADGPNWGATL
jgi:DNA polymerase I-like protein with 3'-5' exonuclease and polymerase domains